MIRKFARPYAKALMEIQPDPAQALRTLGELVQFERARASSADLEELFRNPGFDAETRIRVTRTMSDRLGLSDLSKRIIEVLVRNHRINDLHSIIEAWRGLINQALGVSVAEVRTAHTLAPDEQATLQASLEKRFGRKIELRLSTDASLLGGFIAQVESEVYDASVSGQINKFKASLT